MSSPTYAAPPSHPPTPFSILNFDSLRSGSLLTPPASPSIDSSPPPRQEGEDYFAPKSRKTDKKKRSRKADRSTPHLASHSGETATTPPNAQARVHPSAQAELIASTDVVRDPDDSPAIDALRRVSQSFAQTSSLNFENVRDLSRSLTQRFSAMSWTRRKSRENLPKAEQIARESGSGTSPTRKLVSIDTNNDQGVGSQAAREDQSLLLPRQATPASIILRKASEYLNSTTESNIEPTPTASNIGDSANARDPPLRLLTYTPNSQALQSNPIEERSSTSPSPTDPRENQTRLKSTSASENLLPTTGRPSRTMTGGSSYRFNVAAGNRRHSFVAEPVITVAEFRPAPGTLVGPRSRGDSILSERSSHRTSTIQILSPLSVHEVIWREDETSSSGDSSTPTSLKGNGFATLTKRIPVTVTTRNDGNKSPGHTSLAIVTEAGKKKSPIAPEHAQSEKAQINQSSNVMNTGENLSAWSWDKHDFPSAASKSIDLLEPCCSASTHVPSTQHQSLSNPETPLTNARIFPGLSKSRSMPDSQSDLATDLDDSVLKRKSGERVRLIARSIDAGIRFGTGIAMKGEVKGN